VPPFARSPHLLVAALACSSLTARPAAAESLRCGRRLVSVGDTRLELEARCGPPDHKTEHTRRAVQRVTSALGLVSAATGGEERIERWLYADDEGRLVRLVELRRGHVTGIDTIAVRARDDTGCARAVFADGTPAAQIEHTCGAPDDRAAWTEVRSTRVGRVTQTLTVERETWIYAPGPGRLLRVLELTDGRLTQRETGGRAPRVDVE
jgi:hypothetical protein